MTEINAYNADTRPGWLGPGGRLLEGEFAAWFRNKHRLACVDGHFFGVEGCVHDESKLRKAIYEELRPWVFTGLARKVDALLEAMRLEYREDQLRLENTRIHVANGTLDLIHGFSPVKEICRSRLPVEYDESSWPPELWLRFLDELLEPEDIDTLQEFMGYCLIPTTVAQKMLLIIGEGGEGKSRVGVVLGALLGRNMNTGSLSKVENNTFAVADLENKLLMVDDDLRLEALKKTDRIKSLVTAELPMDLERKGVQSYQGTMYVRFMGFGNGTLQALHDRSFGFFRRQIILTAKPRPGDRVDDPFLGTRLKQELPGIFIWAVQGLMRLLGNDFRFTESRGSRENLRESMLQGNNVLDFMESEGYFYYDPCGSTPTRSLYRAYRDWCEDNAIVPLGSKSFSGFLIQNQQRYGIRHIKNVRIGNGRNARGFAGLSLCGP